MLDQPHLVNTLDGFARSRAWRTLPASVVTDAGSVGHDNPRRRTTAPVIKNLAQGNLPGEQCLFIVFDLPWCNLL